jgi:hypothetical protein
MQFKVENFNELPAELKFETAQNLSNRELVNLAQTSKYHLSLFKPMIDVRKLLHHVVRGQHDAVQSILTDDISFMFRRGFVMDCSGREFENISAFEYALWALDKHMWTVMITCIPQNEEGRKVFAQLIAQYNKVNTDGVTYKLNGQTITEKHFDFKNTIIKELQTQVESIFAPGTKNLDAIDKQGREGVGGAQNLFPMHVVYEYCSDELFRPVPKFTSQPKSSKQFYNRGTEKYENWFNVDSKLSVDFMIFKAFGVAACETRWSPTLLAEAHGWVCAGDLAAMTALCEVRTKDFIELKSQLEDQMTLGNHHQVSQI